MNTPTTDQTPTNPWMGVHLVAIDAETTGLTLHDFTHIAA